MASKMTSFRMDEYTIKFLDYIANAESTNKSEIVRAALESYFEKTFRKRSADPEKRAADAAFIRSANEAELEKTAKALINYAYPADDDGEQV